MIKSLKRRFIIISCIIIFVVAQIIAGVIIVINYNNVLTRTDSSISNIMRYKPDDTNTDFKGEGQMNMRYFIVEVSSNGEATLNTERSKDDTITNSNFLDFYNNINKNKGIYNYYRYITFDHDDSTKTIVFVNIYIDMQAFYTSSLTTEFVLLIAFIVISLLLILLSNKLFKHTITAYQKQKEFITNASHELKTPLTIISANNELIKYEYNDNDYTNVIDNQIIKLNKLINQMIQQAKLDEDRKLEKQDFDLSLACLDSINMFSNLIKQSNKSLSSKISNDIIYNGDEEKIRHLLSILLDNANKYCDDCGVIEFSLVKRKRIFISVINSYKDVSNINVDSLFERFYRENKSRGNSNSYGLGLSIALGIVEKHNGEIKAIKHDEKIEFLVKL